MAHPLMHENIWFERNRFQEAETKYQEHLASQRSGLVVQKSDGPASNLVSEIARARQNIQSSLSAGVGLSVGVGVDNPEILARLSAVEKENADLRKITTDLQAAVAKLTERLSALDTSAAPPASQTKPVQNGKAEDDDEEDDDDFDFFGSDESEEESEEKKRQTEERLAKYQEKKAKKPGPIAKSNIIFDVKPWDDETDMGELEKAVRSVEKDGLLWGASKLVPLAYGIKKLQITCVVEDEKVGTEDIEEALDVFEDLIQSVDVAAFNKV
ncbi:elongation factor 1-delta-like [Lytechinus variegatus]|uniref:elongation factor 1-delta-like n=1 Tax=Lytechinus variegatus TaxID=7654 RepID=UPI001BB17F7D|nr:elongation factor 1-delta-like [Lytechinus variegatus]